MILVLSYTYKFLLVVLVLIFAIYKSLGISVTGMFIDSYSIALKTLSYPRSFIKNVCDFFIEKNELINEVKLLQNKLEELSLWQKNATLYPINSFAIPTQIIGIPKKNVFSSFVIFVPRPNLIEVGDIVTKNLHAVGRVVDAGNIGARVLPITDPRSKISVIFENTKIQAIVSGGNNGELVVTHSSKDLSTVIENEKVITSGLDKFFPPGILVGSVQVIDKNKIKIKTFDELEPLSEVVVLKNKKNIF